MWRGAFLALVYSAVGCGGSEFKSPATGGSGGAAGSGGSSATGGSGGNGGSPSGGGTAGAGNVGGSAGSGGSAGATGPGPIIIVNVSQMGSSLNQDVPTLELGFTPTPGNAIIVGITCHSTADGLNGLPGDCTLEPGAVTDNQGNTYERIVQGQPITSSEQGARPYIFIAENIVAPNSEVVLSVDPLGTVPDESQLVAWGAIEVSGLAAAPSLDAWGISPTGSDSSTQVIADPAILQPNELAIGVLTIRSDDTNMMITAEADWTTHHVNQNGTDNNPPGHAMVSRVTTQVGQVSHTWTHDPPSRGAAGVIATFRGALTE